ncbi:UDP-N-acetylglucosamine 2-epimerase (non-hydrolyzing) [Paenibacillus filicis]|uniref:UDP-N-acetylglucosamine 2-epimerase (Non-hydrolyzing) n=1 Tax=Paenibacillus gyeongsangnamensis TaxID=3388067 RepID=A0ABT4Q9P6_9BACL|nr:UDP-N-acetylglucosamine 2-epimerase (non-hydrolyzing) [Paenibacillus filicis]MCZ8513602.1 UDP-N-acetylglucosamine 2-epimerase (non-hydrolyzing) [Paenibacillus filicis]
MKIVTILGTRPEIIRLSLIIQKLDKLAEKHILVHTGQNFTHSLSDIFFQEMGLRAPDYILRHRQQSLGAQLSTMFGEVEKILLRERPDKVLLLGDTNSALCAIVAERMGIPVIHMEAGNRCFDLTVPEEKNRKVIDAVSSINMPYTPQSKQHLLKEGVPSNRIVVSGNPIYEVLQAYASSIDESRIFETLNLSPKSYFLVTAHRAENVDDPVHLREILGGLNQVAEAFGYRMICSMHPRTRSRIEKIGELRMHPLVEFHEPFGFFDFVKLERHALCVMTDSGTVQEECCIFHVPTVTMRNTTERPETVDCGSNVITGLKAGQIADAVKLMVNMQTDWAMPQGYLDADVSSKVVKFLLGGQ